MNTKLIEEILVPYLTENGFKLYDVSFVKEAGMHILRVLVSKKEGINIDELALINNYLSDELDKLWSIKDKKGNLFNLSDKSSNQIHFF